MSTFSDLIPTRRTIRQFERRPIERKILESLVDAARLAPSAGNLQPLEFVVVDDPAQCGQVFGHLRWAAYIAPRGNPKPGQEPAAYVVVLANSKIRDKMYEYDVGAAMMSMILLAWEGGLGSCWLISVDKPELARLLAVPDEYKVDSVLALGYPAERPQAENFKDSPRYWQDESGTLHVPKRRLESIIHFNRF